jgi:aldehyde dehydrogenase (NAD+)
MSLLSESTKKNIHEIFNTQKANASIVKREPISTRKEKLKKLKAAIETREEEILAALHKDLRKPAFESLVWEVYLMYGEIDHALKNLSDWAKPHNMPSHLLMMMNDNKIMYEPKGVCLIVGPWNFPFQLTIGPLISAIAAGNCSIIKPASMTPATSAIVAKLIKETFSPNEITVVEGDSQVATELMSLPFDHIFFTGSPSVGKIVMNAASKHLTSVTLELGGKSPVIVDETSNLKKAAQKITWGKFSNSGQACIAPDYAFVHESKVAAFIELMKVAIKDKYFIGDKLNKEDYCKIVNGGNFNRVKGYYDDAISKGAKVETGGVFEENDHTIHPTILTNVSKDSLIMEEEIFGPLFPIITYKNIDEVTQYINSKDKPLALYIFSSKNKNINKILKETTAGGSCVNDVMIHFTNPNIPFGGVNTSGIGNAHGFFGFKAFSHERSVMYQSALSDFNSIVHPPYSGLIKKLGLKLYKLFV